MNNKIEPGVLCLVYGLRRDVEHNGRLVTPIRWLCPGDYVEELSCYYLRSGEWLCAERGGQLGGYLPANLMPLHPPAEEPSRCARQSKLTPA